MANYKCNAACRHCLYACSPERTGGYITEQIAKEVCGLLRSAGCRSVHIGGGEPFLDFDGLVTLVHTITGSGIAVEYIETNAYWTTDLKQVEHRLKALAHAGTDTLCISTDPFHAEYVPPDLPIMLANICRSAGFGYFLWQERYLSVLPRLESGRTYTRAELERFISPRYVLETANSYGLHLGGRAVNIEAEYSARKAADTVADDRTCRNLLSGGHFHIDLYGRFIPPGCTGIAIPLDEAVHGIPDGKYPVLEVLISGGSMALLRYAEDRGFVAEEKGYPSGCALCFHIRHWLCENAPSPELDAEHYTESLKYYG